MVYRWPQPRLREQVERFLTHARLPQIQAVIARLGYDLTALDEAKALLQGWLDLQQESYRLDIASQTATEKKTAAKNAAEAEDRALCDLINLHFPDDPGIRYSLGLPMPRQSKHRPRPSPVENKTAEQANTEPTEAVSDQAIVAQSEQPTQTVEQNVAQPPTKKKRHRPSRSIAARLDRWRGRFKAIEELPDNYKQVLDRFGWPYQRRRAAAALVEAFSEADFAQRDEVANYRVTSKQAQEAERAVRDWYRLAAGICGPAVRRDAPENYRELLDLLGLPPVD
jgi:hypothetical protein